MRMNIHSSFFSLIPFLLFSYTTKLLVKAESEFGAIFCHGHSIKGKVIRNCPKKVCEINPTEKLYFWRYVDERFPHITLSTWSDVKIPLSSVDIDFASITAELDLTLLKLLKLLKNQMGGSLPQ